MHKSIHILQPLQADTPTKVAKRVCFSPTQKEFQIFSFHPSEKIKTPDSEAMTTQTKLGNDRQKVEQAKGNFTPKPLTEPYVNLPITHSFFNFNGIRNCLAIHTALLSPKQLRSKTLEFP